MVSLARFGVSGICPVGQNLTNLTTVANRKPDFQREFQTCRWGAEPILQGKSFKVDVPVILQFGLDRLSHLERSRWPPRPDSTCLEFVALARNEPIPGQLRSGRQSCSIKPIPADPVAKPPPKGRCPLFVSEVNANPADTEDHPQGVWTLPPSLRLGAEEKAKYQSIGESDRMTLRFRKPE